MVLVHVTRNKRRTSEVMSLCFCYFFSLSLEIITIPSVSQPRQNIGFAFFCCVVVDSQVYDTTAMEVVDSSLQGYNATVFAYGQTVTILSPPPPAVLPTSQPQQSHEPGNSHYSSHYGDGDIVISPFPAVLPTSQPEHSHESWNSHYSWCIRPDGDLILSLLPPPRRSTHIAATTIS